MRLWVVFLLLMIPAAVMPNGIQEDGPMPTPPTLSDHGESEITNRLASSSSPYLLLHQNNPVDWYPWGSEALEKARDEGKPIFLSIGYSSCYWCHVMERESFANVDTAAMMNEHFVSIKVDREERPDLDEIYMAATQILTGRGGWPNSVFLTPDLKPFFAGTYFPPEDRPGQPGFTTVLKGVARAWREQRPQIAQSAEQISERIGIYLKGSTAPSETTPSSEASVRSLADLTSRFDQQWGGFGGAPKFPTPSNLFFLLEMAEDDHAAKMLRVTLDQMSRGGIYDQLGGGFHRYATDNEWKVPHFEKMLYDNGLLLEVYARAYELDPDPEWRRVMQETVGWLEREMLGPEGAFWSAIDAETDAHEGAYYVWTREELGRVLGGEDADALAPLLGFSDEPFFEGSHYVLHFPARLVDLASERKTNREELLERMEPWRRALLAARTTRKRPLTDDKILTDWNGLTIAGLATAGRVLGDPSMVVLAENAANFVLDSMWLKQGEGRQLQHAYRGGEAHIPAFLADYSYLTHGLLALAEVTKKPIWLDAARELVAEQSLRLGDAEGAFFVAAESDDVLFRSRDPFDGAVPSANGVALWNLLDLAERTDAEEYRTLAKGFLGVFASLVDKQPSAARSIAIGARRFAVSEVHGKQESAGPSLSMTTPAILGGFDPLAEARGVVKSRLELGEADASGQRFFRLFLQIGDGWHINANPASLGFLIPTSVVGKGAVVSGVEYPEGEPLRFDFADAELSVYEGTIELVGFVEPDRESEVLLPSLELTYQACDDIRCLAPVSHELQLP